MKNAKYIIAGLFVIAVAAALVLFFRAGDAGPRAGARAVRIISASPQVTEIVYALGLEDRIVGVSSDSDFPPACTKKPKVGTFWQLNMESIVAAKPDLVILEKFEQQLAVGKRLQEIGIPVVYVSIDTIDQFLAALPTIGKATGTEPAANSLALAIKSRIINLSGRLTSGSKPSVLWVMQTEPVRIAGRETFPNELIELAGANNAIGPTVQKYPPIGAEQIVACHADVIIQPAFNSPNIAAEQKAAEVFWSKWPMLPAVKNHRIYVINPDTVSRLTPRLDQGLELVGHCIHPKMFETSPVENRSNNAKDPNS